MVYHFANNRGVIGYLWAALRNLCRFNVPKKPTRFSAPKHPLVPDPAGPTLGYPATGFNKKRQPVSELPFLLSVRIFVLQSATC